MFIAGHSFMFSCFKRTLLLKEHLPGIDALHLADKRNIRKKLAAALQSDHNTHVRLCCTSDISNFGRLAWFLLRRLVEEEVNLSFVKLHFSSDTQSSSFLTHSISLISILT